MSKKPKPAKKSFKYKTTATLPKLAKVKTEWDLASLYYSSENDPQIEKNISKTEKAYLAFAKKWKNKKFTTSAKTLLVALSEKEKLAKMPEAARAGRYFSFRTCLNAKDEVANKKQALLGQRFRKLSSELLFFGLEIGKLSKTEQKKLLADTSLQHFHYYLHQIFLSSKYDLSEAEEKIIKLKRNQSYGMWTDAVERIISNRTISWKGAEMAIPEALETINTLGTKDKRKLWDILISQMEQIGEFAEHEFNAIITDVRTEEDLRGYKKPYSSTALSYEDSEKSIENLVSTVSTEGFELSKKFYKLKAAAHGVDKLHYTQKYDSIGQAPSIPWKQAVEICRDVFYNVKNEYGSVFDRMLANGQIDVSPKKGKRGGAFMSAEVSQPTQVFLNHLDDFKSLETLAHEMGHAIHAERSKKQTPFYEGHSITTAETASTLFENLLFDAVYDQAEAKTKPILLHDRITRDIATIQRQIAFFNCELEIHNTISSQGAMTNDELRDCMYSHLKTYLGPAISLDKRDGYSYVYIPHLRYGFYVYTYTFGILMSTIMANHYKADPGYIDEIDKFLCSGAAASVADIFASIGIDTSKANTFSNALQNHAADIKSFEQYTKQTTKRKK